MQPLTSLPLPVAFWSLAEADPVLILPPVRKHTGPPSFKGPVPVANLLPFLSVSSSGYVKGHSPYSNA